MRTKVSAINSTHFPGCKNIVGHKASSLSGYEPLHRWELPDIGLAALPSEPEFICGYMCAFITQQAPCFCRWPTCAAGVPWWWAQANRALLAFDTLCHPVRERQKGLLSSLPLVLHCALRRLTMEWDGSVRSVSPNRHSAGPCSEHTVWDTRRTPPGSSAHSSSGFSVSFKFENVLGRRQCCDRWHLSVSVFSLCSFTLF